MKRLLRMAFSAFVLAAYTLVPLPALAATMTITPPANIVTNTDAGLCSAVVTYSHGTVTGGTAPVTVSGFPPSGGAFPKGTTVVTLTATDAVGDTAMATFTVTVNDTEPPTIVAPPDVTAYTGPGSTVPFVTVDPGSATATDNCPGVTVTNPGAAVYPVGNTTVTYTATDTSGNTAAANQVVTVIDNTPPTISVPSGITVHAPDASGTTVTYTATAQDNVAAFLRCSPPSGGNFPVGATTVTCTADDASGNSVSASFTVVVINDAPAGAVNSLITSVSALGLPAGTTTSLLSKLNDALAAMAAGDTAGACGDLGAFINAVQAQSGKKISAADGAILVVAATDIRTMLGCS